MKARICTSTLLFLLLQLSMSAVADPIVPGSEGNKTFDSKELFVKETGDCLQQSFIWPTSGGELIIGKDGKPTGESHRLTNPLPSQISKTGCTWTFHVQSTYKGIVDNKLVDQKVSDYRQQTGDPAVLQASAFEAGVMVDSLWDWLSLNGYGADNPIFQPDFFLVGGGDVYFAVDLAALGAAGKAFVDTWDFGSIFSINAFGGLDDMPFYMFSSTLFDYTEGSGWTGGTPLAEGTQVSFDAFHETSAAVPEPGTLLLVGIGLAGAWFRRRGNKA